MLTPKVEIRVNEIGARKTAASLNNVNNELDDLGDSGKRAKKSTEGLVGALGNLGTKIDKDLEQSFGRIFRSTDRLSSLLGQLKNVGGLVALGVTAMGVAATAATAAFNYLRDATSTATIKVNVFERSMDKLRTTAIKTGAEIDALALATQGLSGGRFDLTVDEQMRVMEIQREELEAAKQLGQIRQDQLNREQEIAALRKKYPDGFVDPEHERELQRKLDYQNANLEALKEERAEIIKNAQARRRSIADEETQRRGGRGAAGAAPTPTDPNLLLAQQLPTTDIASEEAALFKSLEPDTPFGDNIVAGLDAITSAAAEAENAFLGLSFEVSNLLDKQEALDLKQFNDDMYALGNSIISTGKDYASAAINAGIYGGSVEGAINATANAKFYNALLTIGELAFQIPLASVFAPQYLPALGAGLAGATAQLAVSGGVGAATGGINAMGSGGGGGQGGTLPTQFPQGDPFGSDDDGERETVFNINLVASSESPRQDAYAASVALTDILRIGGIELGGR